MTYVITSAPSGNNLSLSDDDEDTFLEVADLDLALSEFSIARSSSISLRAGEACFLGADFFEDAFLTAAFFEAFFEAAFFVGRLLELSAMRSTVHSTEKESIKADQNPFSLLCASNASIGTV